MVGVWGGGGQRVEGGMVTGEADAERSQRRRRMRSVRERHQETVGKMETHSKHRGIQKKEVRRGGQVMLRCFHRIEVATESYLLSVFAR